MAVEVKPVSVADLLAGPPCREFILLAGKDGSGKSSALVSLAGWVQGVLDPGAAFYVIETENKLKPVLQTWGPDLPTNLQILRCGGMNDVTDAVDLVIKAHKPGDWLGVESMSRIWERAQDLGYKAVSGLDKASYMEKRRIQTGKKDPVTPRPDDLWSVTKGAHDGAFLDLLSQTDDLNVLLTTTMSRPPKEGGFMKENQARKDVRDEFGIDLGLEGAPRLPYYVQTLGTLDRVKGVVSCRMLRDNLSALEDPAVTFPVPNRKDWGPTFWSTCRP